MDEYEQLEQELERYYEQYVGRFRNLDYLEHEVDELNREETERMEENDRALKRMQKRLRDEEWRLLRGEDDEKGGEKRKPPKAGGRKKWAPPNGAAQSEDEDDASSMISGSDASPPISVDNRSSHESGDEVTPGHAPMRGLERDARVEAPVSLGGSVTDDDILNESEEEGDDISDDDRGVGGPRGGKLAGGSDFDF